MLSLLCTLYAYARSKARARFFWNKYGLAKSCSPKLQMCLMRTQKDWSNASVRIGFAYDRRHADDHP